MTENQTQALGILDKIVDKLPPTELSHFIYLIVGIGSLLLFLVIGGLIYVFARGVFIDLNEKQFSTGGKKINEKIVSNID